MRKLSIADNRRGANRKVAAKPGESRIREASRARREREREILRTAILKEAGDLFVELGYEGFSMRKVAARIGYSATTIYHHFKDKDALLMALLGEAFCAFGQTLDAAGREFSDPMERVAATGKAYIRYAQENPVLFRLMFLRRPDYFLAREQERFRDRHDGYASLVRDAQAMLDRGFYAGHSRDAVAAALWASVHGLAMLSLTTLRDEPGRIEDAAKVLFQFDPRSLSAESPRGESGKNAGTGDRSARRRCSKGNNGKSRNGETK